MLDKKSTNNNSLIQPNYHIPFWNGHDSTNYNLKEIIIMGTDKYPRQYQGISSECWLLLPACALVAPLC